MGAMQTMDEYIITEKKKQVELIALVCAVSFVMTFDYGCLNISFSAIAEFFGTKLAAVSWLATISFLIITGALLSFAKLGDIIGYKKVFLRGVVIYAIGALCYALSWSFPVLLVSRIIQSFGEAMFLPLGIAMLSAFLPDQIKGKAFGFYATAQGLGIALGQAGGGWLIDKFSWRATAYTIILIALIVFLAAKRIIPLKQKKNPDRRLDLLGAILFFISMASLLYLLNSATKIGPDIELIIIYVSIPLIALFLFILREKSISYPLLDLSLFKNLDFSFAVVAAFLVMVLNIGTMFIFPMYLEFLKHYSVFQRGLIMLGPSLAMMLFSPLGGALSDRAGSRKVCIWGMTVVIVSFVLLCLLQESSSILFIIFSLILLGAGMGFFIAPNNRLVLSFASADKHGVASGIYKICMNAGSTVGIAIFMLVGTQVVLSDITRLNILIPEVKNHPDVMILGFHGVFIFGVALGIATLIFSILAHDKK